MSNPLLTRTLGRLVSTFLLGYFWSVPPCLRLETRERQKRHKKLIGKYVLLV
jgi:hypothetical protein